MPDPQYYDNVNFDLLKIIPSNARIVVEVGCGAGALGHQYKLSHPDCQYIGIDCHSEATRIAEQRLDRVITSDVETLDEGTLDFIGQVDCLVYGDVLEHLVDPWAVTKRQASWLGENGQVIACIPNIGHWSILMNLLMGRWDYQDQGLLDRTHLRFFTLQSIQALFEQAGLKIGWIRSRPIEHDVYSRWLELLIPLLREIGRDPEQFDTQARAFQYVIQATKHKSPFSFDITTRDVR